MCVPQRANSSATPRPIPLDPPVTTATWPLRLVASKSGCGCVLHADFVEKRRYGVLHVFGHAGKSLQA